MYLHMLFKYIYYITALACLLLAVGATDSTSTTTTSSDVDSAISSYPDGVLIIDGEQTSCMVALVSESFGFVSAACLMPSGDTTAIPASRMKLAINGLQSAGQISVSDAVVHPSYDPSTLANNIGIVYFDVNSGGKSNSGNSSSVAAAKCDITKTYLERRTLSSLSPMTWNSPPTIIPFSSNSDDVCDIGSPVYAANKDAFICNNDVANPGSGLSSCALPLGLGYTAITGSSALPSAVYSHSVVFGDGLCSGSKMVHYYIIISNYLAWGAQVAQTLKAQGASAKSASIAADYSMTTPSEAVPVIEVYSGNLYSQVPVPMASATESGSSSSFTTYYVTTTSCDSDDGSANSSPSSTPPPGSGSTSLSSTMSDSDSFDISGADDCTDDIDCSDSNAGDDPFAGIVNIVTMSNAGNNVYVPVSNNPTSTSSSMTMDMSMSGDMSMSMSMSGDSASSANTIFAGSTYNTGSDTSSGTDTASDGSAGDSSSSSDMDSASAAKENEKTASGGISRTTAILIAVLVPISVLAIFVCLYFYWRRRTHV
ncbi:hypothetical protein EV175_000235 [Coemansia sp. RSA 1933]|nr:hypothetical protein EV175_000235 [Coemansia sp. RSA 1933]